MLLKLLRCPFKSQISCHNYNIPSMSPSKVGGPILLTNNPRKQKKNKVNICSILINNKKIIIWAQVIELFCGMFFLFLNYLKIIIIGGMLLWLGLLVFTTKRTYNHSIWNLILNIHFLITKLF